ncbi:hypothetical protein LTR85_004361 [Meristemomyces frigidus]|nr:hypothetical protein LTR85_004361 [Meristemomyces frigidus]
MDASPLSRLPAELRNIIYELVLASDDGLAIDIYNKRPYVRSSPPAHIILALTAVCWQMRSECLPIVRTNNDFYLISHAFNRQHIAQSRVNTLPNNYFEELEQWQGTCWDWLLRASEHQIDLLRNVHVDICAEEDVQTLAKHYHAECVLGFELVFTPISRLGFTNTTQQITSMSWYCKVPITNTHAGLDACQESLKAERQALARALRDGRIAIQQYSSNMYDYFGSASESNGLPRGLEEALHRRGALAQLEIVKSIDAFEAVKTMLREQYSVDIDAVARARLLRTGEGRYWWKV